MKDSRKNLRGRHLAGGERELLDKGKPVKSLSGLPKRELVKEDFPGFPRKNKEKREFFDKGNPVKSLSGLPKRELVKEDFPGFPWNA